MNFHLQCADKKGKVWANRSARACNIFIDFAVTQSTKKRNQWKNNLKENTTSAGAFDKRPAAAASDWAARFICRLRTDILIFHPELKGGASSARLFLP